MSENEKTIIQFFILWTLISCNHDEDDNSYNSSIIDNLDVGVLYENSFSDVGSTTTSGYGGGIIDDILIRMKSELPYFKVQTVMNYNWD